MKRWEKIKTFKKFREKKKARYNRLWKKFRKG
jgi:hypothetical protein